MMHARLVTALMLGVVTLAMADLRAQETVPSQASLVAFEAKLVALTKKIVPATVGLRSGGAQGSGVIVTKDGYVLTAAHVFDEPNRPCTIILHDGKRVKAKTLGRQVRGDFGIVKITEKGPWPHVEMGSMDDMDEEDLCVATGHPGGWQRGRTAPLRLGRITRKSGPFVRTTNTINHGDSGGPLFDLEGRVIGIHSRIQFQATSNYHVSVDKYRKHWGRLVAGRSWSGREPDFSGNGAVLGIRANLRRGEVRVTEVYPDKPAEKAGLRSGDVVAKMDGVEIESVDDLAEQVKLRKPGDEVDFQIKRGDETLEITVTLGGNK